MELLKKTDYSLNNIQKEEVQGNVLNSIESLSRNPIPMLYQSGYLTIKGYDDEFQTYNLDFPNMEVEQGFIKYLIQ